MAKLGADKADQAMIEQQAEKPAGGEEWTANRGKIDEENPLEAPRSENPEQLGKEDRVAVIKTHNAQTKPKYPYIEFNIVGRALAYDDKNNGAKIEEDFQESTIQFVTVGNKDIDQINRYRREKGYAVVGYGNFPPEHHEKYKEFSALKKELDSIISPPESKGRRKGS